MIEIGCQIEYDSLVVNRLCRKKDLDVLKLFVGKNSTLDNALFKRVVKCDEWWCRSPWLEGITFVVENGKDIQNFQSVEQAFETCRNMEGLKYFHSLGLPWCLDTTRKILLLCEIACFNELDKVKWAYENGCKGGSCLNEEDIKSEFRDRKEWIANRSFFIENGILAPMDIQEISIPELESQYASRTSMLLSVDYSTLESLVDRGYNFCSSSEKESIIQLALTRCIDYPCMNDRKRLALFQKMVVCQSSSSKLN